MFSNVTTAALLGYASAITIEQGQAQFTKANLAPYLASTMQTKSIEDSVYILEPAEVKALVEDGMTKELLETVGSQIDVHFKMTTVDEVIDALNAFGPPTKKYDLASLKARIMQGASPSQKNELLKEIFEDKELGPAITKCDAFELSAFVDPWRALRDLREADPLRA